MLVELSNEIKITEFTEHEASLIKASLVLDNPSWVNAMNLGKSVWNIEPKLKFFSEIDDTLHVPIGFLSSLQTLFGTLKIIDKRYVSKQLVDIDFKGKLYDYQEVAVKEMLSTTNGVLCSITGSGKTAMACNMIASLKQPALVLVDTIELANQFTERLLQFTTITEVGRLGNGVRDIKPITVATLQTLARIPQEELKALEFGVVVVDETHIVPAETFARVVGTLCAKYKYGLSATPERADGLTKAIFWLTGPLRHSVATADVADKIIKPDYISIDTNYTYPLFDTTEYGNMITDIGENAERNKLIVDTIKQYKTQQCVLLCHRQEHVKTLQAMIPGSVILLSSTPKKERAQTIKDLELGLARIVITTWQLFHKGIDLAELEILLICAPTRSKVWIKQSAGRLMRVSKKIKKKPLIIDLVDKKVDLLKFQWYSRRKILQNL